VDEMARQCDIASRRVIGMSIIVASVMLFSITACGNRRTASSGSSTTSVSRTSRPPTTSTTIVDPSELPAIDPTTARADLGYLEAQGANLLAMVGAVEQATVGNDALDPKGCSALLASLTAAGSPEALSALAGGVTDEVTRSALEAVRSAAVAIVAACERPDVTVPSAPDPGAVTDPVTRGVRATALFRQRVAEMKGT